MQFAQYDVVKVKAILKDVSFEPDGMNRREPRVSDVATFVEGLLQSSRLRTGVQRRERHY
jgi:hypothetical protein